MPREWYDSYSVKKNIPDEAQEFYFSVIADKKPYFMRYIYPDLMRQYNTYIKNTNKKSLREFGLTVDELESLETKTKQQVEFLKYFKYFIPVSIDNSVMNRICRRFENEFDGYIGKYSEVSDFDYSILKNNFEYSRSQYFDIQRIYKEYNNRVRNYMMFSMCEKVSKEDLEEERIGLMDDFRKECSLICSNGDVLSNIIVDMCYSKKSTKSFAWAVCSENIINTLLKNNNGVISYPTLDDNGDIYYCGKRFSINTKRIGD